MPQIGWLEILAIVIIAILVLGPKEFPIALKKIGSYFGKLKNTLSSFQREVNSVTENIDIEKNVTEEKKATATEIDILRKKAPEKINKIAIETSSELLQKLIGAEINNSSITAIVDDLSKRNGDKYYGN